MHYHCRTRKAVNRKGQVLFINALNEVTRKNAQSYLEDKHIEKIAKAYDKYESDGDIAKVVTIKDIAKNDYSLSIPLYIQTSSEEKKMIELSKNVIQTGKKLLKWHQDILNR